MTGRHKLWCRGAQLGLQGRPGRQPSRAAEGALSGCMPCWVSVLALPLMTRSIASIQADGWAAWTTRYRNPGHSYADASEPGFLTVPLSEIARHDMSRDPRIIFPIKGAPLLELSHVQFVPTASPAAYPNTFGCLQARRRTPSSVNSLQGLSARMLCRLAATRCSQCA